jgi:hypothetical protein
MKLMGNGIEQIHTLQVKELKGKQPSYYNINIEIYSSAAQKSIASTAELLIL